MNQEIHLMGDDSFILTRIELFNWGGFQGLHQATINQAGTAVIGSTGSGKTTLVDALMTLLCANPRYNLASTGGHESDRDLISYVRGVSGPGDGGEGQSHIARPGKTVTGIAATLERKGQMVRLGALLWFDTTSSSVTDMKRLWLFSDSPEQTLEHWLNVYHDGGMRLLKKMEKETTGIWAWPNKKQYLARLRDYFDVGENAFTLLNRAAGLKQLNSIDEIFRELVLDDHSAFERAAEVANSFDDLTEIHQELETARKQQGSLQPIALSWEKHQDRQRQLADKRVLESLLPAWFAEQASHLWQQEVSRLETTLDETKVSEAHLRAQLESQKKVVTDCLQRYLQVGGTNIDELNNRIDDWQNTLNQRETLAHQYRQLTHNLGLPSALTQSQLEANQHEAEVMREQLTHEIKLKQDEAYQKGALRHNVSEQLRQLEAESAEIALRPDSNLPAHYQAFRSELAKALDIDEAELPFVAELVQVKPEEASWRGAIERAIGSHRLRILVSPESAPAALNWVNQRHNRLHVRLMEVKLPHSPVSFFDDGFTRKLLWKDHPWREAVKGLLAGIDRHCVDSPEQLRAIPHAMTAQGLMSGKQRFYDKQDQKRLDEDWLTGFDNRDRMAFLAKEIVRLQEQMTVATQELELVKGEVNQLQLRDALFQRIQQLDFNNIDVPGAIKQLEELKERLENLIHPDSDASVANMLLNEARQIEEGIEKQLQEANKELGGLEKSLDRALGAERQAQRVAQQGMTDEERQLSGLHFPTVAMEQLSDIYDLERQHAGKLQREIEGLKGKQHDLNIKLTKFMSGAKNVDTGALAEVGTELDDIPAYLQRLQELTEEALPEKLQRFLDYLNRSSDDGVTQLLSHIDQAVLMIEERLSELNATMFRVDFQPDRYLRLVTKKVIHESLRTLEKTRRQLNAARLIDDNGESHYKALQSLVALLRDACERNRTLGAKALLDPRFRLEFAVSVMDRHTGNVIESRTGSQGGSGGEKEIIASYVLTASLSYALCPKGSSHPLFGTIILDEAFSRSSHAVAGRIIAALKEFGLHAVFITPNKEMRLLRHHTRSAIVVHRRGQNSNMVSLSWEELENHYQRRTQEQHELT
ncbi:ATP-binding protein [Xenorhabdus sp. IM139775]|nr:ATP-binding protein [Xenorhabdus sp. IM139775]MDC9594702.1 ATP-binding protein [Xenorhabdus sp. IM139775]